MVMSPLGGASCIIGGYWKADLNFILLCHDSFSRTVSEIIRLSFLTGNHHASTYLHSTIMHQHICIQPITKSTPTQQIYIIQLSSDHTIEQEHWIIRVNDNAYTLLHSNECLMNTDSDGWRISKPKNWTINTVMKLQACRFTGTVFTNMTKCGLPSKHKHFSTFN